MECYLERQRKNDKLYGDFLLSLNMGFDRPQFCMKKTKDDWHPNYPKNQVRLKYHSCINVYHTIKKVKRSKKSGKNKAHSKFIKIDNKDFKPIFRVSVWGADDCGMDKDFDNALDAKRLYYELRVLPFLNRDELLKRGLQYF